MPEVGLEPTRAEAHWILSPARLPISPLRRYTESSFPRKQILAYTSQYRQEKP